MNKTRYSPDETPDTVTRLYENKLLRNAVFVGAGLVALGTAVGSIWAEFYKEVKKYSKFQKLEEIRTAGTNAAYLKPVAEVTEAVRQVNKEYAKGVAREMRNIGIPKNPVAATFAQASRLGVYDLGGIAMKTAGSLAITLGGYFLVHQNLRLKASNEVQDQRLRELGEKLDQQEAARRGAAER